MFVCVCVCLCCVCVCVFAHVFCVFDSLYHICVPKVSIHKVALPEHLCFLKHFQFAAHLCNSAVDTAASNGTTMRIDLDSC